MKQLRYQLQTIVKELDESGSEIERYIYSTVCVPDDESGRAMAAKEAYNGEIEEYDDGKAAEVIQQTTEERLALIEDAVNVVKTRIETLLKRLGL